MVDLVLKDTEGTFESDLNLTFHSLDHFAFSNIMFYTVIGHLDCTLSNVVCNVLDNNCLANG